MVHKNKGPDSSTVVGNDCECAPVACLGDKTQHNSGTITKITDQHRVLIGGRPVARVGDIATYAHHSESPIYQECLVKVLVNGKRVARLNDRLLCGCIQDDCIATGNPTVLIGGITSEMLPLARPGTGEYVKVGYYHVDGTGVKGSCNIYNMDLHLITKATLDPRGEALVEVPEGTGRVIFEPCDLQEPFTIFPEYAKKPNPLYRQSTAGWVLDGQHGLAGLPGEGLPSSNSTEGGKRQPLENWDMGSLGPRLSGALSSSAEWIWDVLSGEFVEDPSMGQIICRGVLYFIPFIGKALDAQDIAACLYLMLWKGRYKEPMLWFMLVVTLIGCVPVMGDAAKLCLKAIGKGGGKTVHSIMELFETLNLVGKGDGWKFLKALGEDLPGYGKIAAEKITAILGFIAEKLATVKKWAIGNSKVVAKIDEVFEGLRWMEQHAGEMCAQITDELADKLKGLKKNFRKQQGTALTSKVVPEETGDALKQLGKDDVSEKAGAASTPSETAGVSVKEASASKQSVSEGVSEQTIGGSLQQKAGMADNRWLTTKETSATKGVLPGTKGPREIYGEADAPLEAIHGDTVVYRGGEQPIDEVFSRGFSGPTNMDGDYLGGGRVSLAEHTRAKRGSHWISTSQSKDVASNFSGESGYVYEIAKPGGVDVNEVYRLTTDGREWTGNPNASEFIGNMFPWQQEVSYPHLIESKYIKGAYSVTKDISYGPSSHTISIGEFIPNPNFGK